MLSLRYSSSPNHNSGRRIRASVAQADLSQVPVSVAGSGMVQSRVSFSLVCHPPAETDSDHSTMPMSACGHELSRPRPSLAVFGSGSHQKNVSGSGTPQRIRLDGTSGAIILLVATVDVDQPEWRESVTPVLPCRKLEFGEVVLI